MKINILGAEYSVTVSNDTKCLKMARCDSATWYCGQRDTYTGLMKRVRLEPILSIGFNLDYAEDKKEEQTMNVSYMGMTGELEKMERLRYGVPVNTKELYYSLEIWDSEKKCKVSFPNVSLKDVKFLGGEVTYG